MNDRLPGSSYDNPIWYRDYRIYVNDSCDWMAKFTYVHDCYDGAPDAKDGRCGYGPTIEYCKKEIDERCDDE